MADNVAPSMEAPPLDETARQIKEFHDMLHKLFEGVDDIIAARSVASFMGCIMIHTSSPNLIAGFANEVMQYAHLATVVREEKAQQPQGEQQ